MLTPLLRRGGFPPQTVWGCVSDPPSQQPEVSGGRSLSYLPSPFCEQLAPMACPFRRCPWRSRGVAPVCCGHPLETRRWVPSSGNRGTQRPKCCPKGRSPGRVPCFVRDLSPGIRVGHKKTPSTETSSLMFNVICKLYLNKNKRERGGEEGVLCSHSR